MGDYGGGGREGGQCGHTHLKLHLSLFGMELHVFVDIVKPQEGGGGWGRDRGGNRPGQEGVGQREEDRLETAGARPQRLSQAGGRAARS